MIPRFLRPLSVRFGPHRAESTAHRVGVHTLAFLERLAGSTPWDPRRAEAAYTDDRLDLGGEQVMQDWETPLMHALARTVAASHGDVLELGFGMGISATEVQRVGCRSYTIVDANPTVIRRIEKWRKEQPAPVTIIEGRWQDREPGLGLFDGILYDTHPASFADHTDERVLGSLVTLGRHLKPGGVLAYFFRYFHGVPLAHQTVLCDAFSEITVRRVKNLSPPTDCDYWRDESMIFVACRK